MATRRTILKALALASAASLTRQRVLAETPSAEEPLRDPLRPGYHYLPARNWMNDPCGPLFFNGQYHLFHQYNPHGALWGDMHWAHAVSPDMVHWKRQPVALAPTPGSADSEGCFTGTAVVQDGRPTFLYTGVQKAPPADATLVDEHNAFRESQCLAVATDDTLNTWKKLPSPVIPTPPPGMKVTGFRDPSPWREGATWYAVVASGVAKQGGMVLLYRSPDLRTWEYLHPLTEGQWSGTPASNPVDTGEMWECPDFFPLTDTATKQTRHVLIYSTQGKVIWQSGLLDKQAMRFHPEMTGELDYGRVGNNRVTYYAPKTQLDAKGNRILWGWISETRPDAECVQAGWSGMVSLPRLLTLRQGELQMTAAPQVARLRSTTHSPKDVHEFVATLERHDSAEAPQPLSDATGPVLAVQTDTTLSSRTLGITIQHNGKQEQTSIPMPQELPARPTLHVFIDNSVMEIFVDDRFCFTHRFYAREAAIPLATLTLPGHWRLADVQTFALDRIWPI